MEALNTMSQLCIDLQPFFWIVKSGSAAFSEQQQKVWWWRFLGQLD